MGGSLVTFPQLNDESSGSQNILNLYGRIKTTASSVISSFLPEEEVEEPSASHNTREPTTLRVNCAAKSSASVAVIDDGADLSGPDPIPLIDAGDHSDVESMFSTASYSLSKAYLAAQYRRGRKRTLNSLDREFWMKDENAKTCFRCLKGFTTFRRRHHCRVCGQIFCSGCTKLVEASKFHNKHYTRIRCCFNCLSSLTSHSSSEDEDETIDEREHTPRSMSIPTHHHHHHKDEYHFSPRSHSSSITAASAVTSAGTGAAASGPPPPPPPPPPPLPQQQQQQQQQQGMSISPGVIHEEDEITEMYRARSSTRSSVRSFVATTAATAAPTPPALPRHSASAIFPLNRQESVTLNDAALEHLKVFLERVLSDSELDCEVWNIPLLDTLLHLCDFIRADIGKERAEPKDWVKLKRLPGGSPSDIETTNGTVITHNFALRDMPSKVINPRILLISFPLEYSRGTQYMSINPVLAQETEYLKKLVARIKTLEPTVLLSSSHISGVALELLHNSGIVVATGIRQYALERLGRYIQSDPLASMDRLSMSPSLGTCGQLEVRTYREDDIAKSFLFFTGIPTSGSTVLLRGQHDQTKMVKTVMEIMLDVAFSLKMETHLMRDQFVSIPDYPKDKQDPQRVLSSSPFVDFGTPYLQALASRLEDRLVECNNLYKESENDVAIAKLRTELPVLPGGDGTLVKIGQVRGLYEKEAAQSAWMEAKQLWDQMKESNPYMFNPGSHQNIIYSFFLYCNKTNIQCVGPETSLADFYLDTDIPLGMFVENCCGTFNDPCPDGCPNPLGEHKRCYYHGNGVVMVTAKQQNSGISGLQDTILMWNHCKVCDRSTAYAPMSANTWRYSFGKYLELSFWGTPLKIRAGNCNHNIYRDYTRYFGWHDIAIGVEYQPIQLFDVDMPDHSLRWPVNPLIDLKISTFKSLKDGINLFWNSVITGLSKVKVEGLEEDKFAEATQMLAKMRKSAEEDRGECLAYLEEAFIKCDPTDYLGLNIVLRFVQSLVTKYHSEFHNFDGLFFPSEKDIRRVTVQQLKGLLLDDDRTKWSDIDKGESEREQSEVPSETREAVSEVLSEVPSEAREIFIDVPSGVISGVPGGVPDGDLEKQGKELVPEPTEGPTTTSTNEAEPCEGVQSVPVQSKFGTRINLQLSGFQQQLPPNPSNNKVSLLARHFEELSLEFERERKREHQRVLDRQQASAITQTQPIATVFKNLDEAAQDERGDEEDADADNEDSDDERQMQPGHSEKQGQLLDAQEDVQQQQEEQEEAPKPTAPHAERKSLIQSLVNFWAERSSTRWSQIEYMLNPFEHIFSDSIVIIREDEPSSLIAFCLSLPDYKERVEANSSGDDLVSQEQVLLQQKSVHLKYNFVNGNTTMSCKIFFSEQFDALRKQCKCHTHFIQSLSRCNPWQSSGGKSGSVFLKTSDDRFILKSISQSEFDSFTTFAPSYFNYMSQALFHDLPTALAKIFGVYQVHIRNGSSLNRMYLVLTENLFTGRNFTRFFDLKGSMRNRKAAETGKANEVLLDENMVDYIYENPVYVREHSKRRLRTSIYNDTLFLTKMNVMDYSLIIGIDESNNTIVAGIIDYIRAFTWDKKIESWVKGRTTQGAKDPTVISPKQYKVRFRESMEHYFLLVPDCWNLSVNPI